MNLLIKGEQKSLDQEDVARISYSKQDAWLGVMASRVVSFAYNTFKTYR